MGAEDLDRGLLATRAIELRSVSCLYRLSRTMPWLVETNTSENVLAGNNPGAGPKEFTQMARMCRS